MADFNKEKALDDLLKFFKPDSSFSETMKAMQNAHSYLEKIYLDAYQKGLEAGLEKIDINNENK